MKETERYEKGNKGRERDDRQLKSNYESMPSTLATKADNESSLSCLSVANIHICNWDKLVTSGALQYCVCVCVCAFVFSM